MFFFRESNDIYGGLSRKLDRRATQGDILKYLYWTMKNEWNNNTLYVLLVLDYARRLREIIIKTREFQKKYFTLFNNTKLTTLVIHQSGVLIFREKSVLFSFQSPKPTN